MEKIEMDAELTAKGAVHEGEMTCSKCGGVVKHPQDYVMGENGTIICKSCYREILFPHINDCSMELFD